MTPRPDWLQFFGGTFPRARKPHICWLCGKTIEPGKRYWRQTGKLGPRVFAIKHCRETCEILPEVLQQNPQLWKFAHDTTIKDQTP